MSGSADRSRTWRAPGRVNLIGEHTDYNDGFALPLAIQAGCTATVARLAEPRLRVRSMQEDDELVIDLADLTPDAVSGWAAYPAGVVWAVRDRLAGSPGGFTVEVDGDVPLGAGLSSSAALACSVAAALSDLAALDLDQAGLVQVAREAENDFVGAPTGGMDQLASVCATGGHVLLCDMRSLVTEQVPFDLDAAGLALVVIDTHAPHRHSDGEYAARRRSCERAAELLGVPSLRAVQDGSAGDHDAVLARLAAAGGDDELVRRARHILTENARVLDVVARLRAGDVAGIGPLLDASHASMRADFEITVPEVDAVQAAARAAGALGARMTGGGFGGCVIALTPIGRVDAVGAGVRAACAQAEYAEPTVFTVTAGPGVHRL